MVSSWPRRTSDYSATERRILVRVFDKIEEQPAIAKHGQVMTKPHIVELIFDLCYYRANRDLRTFTLLDPGCGDGEFIVEAASRLVKSLPTLCDVESLESCLFGVEKDPELGKAAQARLVKVLELHGLNKKVARGMSQKWIKIGDFLEHNFSTNFDFVVGNPPYVRQEAIDKQSLATYRSQFNCFYDRADLYVAFLERGLELLGPTGLLGFICPNRFTRNRYGTKIRAMISGNFKVIHAIDLAQTSPFTPDVMAYPGIYVIGRGKTSSVNFVHMSSATAEDCQEVREAISKGKHSNLNGVRFHRYDDWFRGSDAWITESPIHLDIVRGIESRFDCLGSPESHTQVGIGVATGADKVFIVPDGFDEVERELLVPLATTECCRTGRLEWDGKQVISPFAGSDSSELIDLRKYPKAKKYFTRHEELLRNRNVGKRNVERWYRTIDRIYPELVHRPKLLIPDIKADGVVVLDKGELYPHHNLYYIVAEHWDLVALRTILRSSIAKFFVWTYGVRMRSNFLRFQAQYLRKIPVPNANKLHSRDIANLVSLDRESEVAAIDKVVGNIYGLTQLELDTIRGAMKAAPSLDTDESS